MEDRADDDELALVRGSGDLLNDLDKQLQRLIFKRPVDGQQELHTLVRLKYLDTLLKLLEPFQNDPQLLDPRLKTIVPPVAEAYLSYIELSTHKPATEGTIDLITALSTILYTLCKIRGRKVISGFLNNEPRHLESILGRLERAVSAGEAWQTRYVLLLWLSHLMLTPFDLTSISEKAGHETSSAVELSPDTPPVVRRILAVCLDQIAQPGAAQEVAAPALSRLVLRPDMQSWQIAHKAASLSLALIQDSSGDDHAYSVIGHLRFLALLVKASEALRFVPVIYNSLQSLLSAESDDSPALDAVGRSLLVKTVRNIVVTAYRAAATESAVASFLEESGALEATIDHLLNTLADKETSVRSSAAKALSAIMLELAPELRQDILQAVMALVVEELPTVGSEASATTDAATCHGGILTLAFALFRRSVPIQQISDIADLLLRALTFAKRTATGSISGTGVRDSANFGLWSLARRYTTAELETASNASKDTLVQTLADNLIQAACCDPVGNIRRGSSAALQELIGRHPNKIASGIPLVQAVDYQAVGLRRRAIIDVAAEAMILEQRYWTPLMYCMLGWRGLGSIDISSREATATSLVQQLLVVTNEDRNSFVNHILAGLASARGDEVELKHGLVLTLAMLAESATKRDLSGDEPLHTKLTMLWPSMPIQAALSPRAIKAELPTALLSLLTAVLQFNTASSLASRFDVGNVEAFLGKVLSRSEDSILEIVPKLFTTLSTAWPRENVVNLMQQMATRVQSDLTRPTLQGASRVFALGALSCARQEFVSSLDIVYSVCLSPHIDWRIAGSRALQVVLASDRGRAALQAHGTGRLCLILLALLQDYTVDERGDIGSQVRLQAITRTQELFELGGISLTAEEGISLQAAVLKLSLEKLTKTRLQAAQCREVLPDSSVRVGDVRNVDSLDYFEAALAPLWQSDTPAWVLTALLTGLISCAGSGAEHILRNARLVVARHTSRLTLPCLRVILSAYANILRKAIASPATISPALDLLAFFLQMRLLHPLQETEFNFRVLLSIVQKSHYKSTDVQRMLSAVAVYTGLGTIGSIRGEVIKKLLSMLKTSPFPKVRAGVADALYALTLDQELEKRDWSKPASQNSGTFGILEKKLLKTMGNA